MRPVLPWKRSLIVPLFVGLTAASCGGEDASSDDTDNSADENDGRGVTTGTGKVDAGSDAGQKPSDAGPGLPDAKPPIEAGPSSSPKLAALAGRYLLRFDVLGTATSPSPLGGEVAIRSRVSTLIVAELAVDGDRLSGTERVCTQSIKQKCLQQCTAATTSVDSRVVKNFLLQRQQRRAYTLAADGTLRGERSIAQLGYDDSNEEADAPTSKTDERVWDVDQGGVREGFLSSLSVTVGLPITCDAYGAQKFVSSFSGKLGGSDSAPTIPEMELKLDGSQGTRLGASNELCEAQEVSSPVEIANARMVRYGDGMNDDAFWNCPAPSVFDQQLPPTEPNL